MRIIVNIATNVLILNEQLTFNENDHVLDAGCGNC